MGGVNRYRVQTTIYGRGLIVTVQIISCCLQNKTSDQLTGHFICDELFGHHHIPCHVRTHEGGTMPDNNAHTGCTTAMVCSHDHVHTMDTCAGPMVRPTTCTLVTTQHPTALQSHTHPIPVQGNHHWSHGSELPPANESMLSH